VAERPLVSVVTPLHNGEAFLSECIESVLAQSYDRWNYTILNNHSTDGSLALAERYAAKDPRIRVVSTDRLLNVMASQNFAFRLIDPAAKYCKMVHADDWLFPECLRAMVELAEAHPTVGLVGAYRLDARPESARVGSDGLPYPSTVVPGGTVCRRSLLGKFSIGSASCILLRADHLRGRHDLLAEDEVFGDLGAWYDILRSSDFGFVHQVLTFTRLHSATVSSSLARFDPDWAADLSLLRKYGPLHLDREEFAERFQRLLTGYYEFLGRNAIGGRDQEFWNYHRAALERLGCSLTRGTVLRAVLRRWRYPVTQPIETFRYAYRFLATRLGLSGN
jgi:glycosyltransferase involved in cell wall biosynthesis